MKNDLRKSLEQVMNLIEEVDNLTSEVEHRRKWLEDAEERLIKAKKLLEDNSLFQSLPKG